MLPEKSVNTDSALPSEFEQTLEALAVSEVAGGNEIESSQDLRSGLRRESF